MYVEKKKSGGSKRQVGTEWWAIADKSGIMREIMRLPTLYYYFLRFWLLPFDEVEPRQVNTSKRLVLNVPFLEFSLRKPHMKELQTILHLLKKEKSFSYHNMPKKRM